MGEYAKYNGEEIKIGTCEDMLYLRADQAHLVTPLAGNTDPVRDQAEIRFRFPFPDEDGLAPGAFDDPFRGITLRQVKSPAGVEHGTVQFKAANGYLASLPCPEYADRGIVSVTADGSDHAYLVHRNGHPGASELVQQRYWKGLLVAVLKCKGCGHMWRLPVIEDAQPVIDALHDMADRELRIAYPRPPADGDEARAVFYRAIADRVAAGYAVAAEVQPATA